MGAVDVIREQGWAVDLGSRGLGDVLLGLAMVRALTELTGDQFDLVYRGPRAKLMDRCDLLMRTESGLGGHTVRTATPDPVRLAAVPEEARAWLDIIDNDLVQAYLALPFRYCLHVEMAAGVALTSLAAPAPRFPCDSVTGQSGHVVFVGTTSMPGRKSYGSDRFAAVARRLDSQDVGCRFSFITPAGDHVDLHAWRGLHLTVHSGIDAAECIDLFASAELVVGNDTGLTHLAALTVRDDGSAPHVIGLYGRHAHTKWITGLAHHHAVATAFSQLVAAADRCPVRDQLDDSLWNESAELADVPPDLVADFALSVLGQAAR